MAITITLVAKAIATANQNCQQLCLKVLIDPVLPMPKMPLLIAAWCAPVAELVDAVDSKSIVFGRACSSQARGTIPLFAPDQPNSRLNLECLQLPRLSDTSSGGPGLGC